jgi:hypothetical protein
MTLCEHISFGPTLPMGVRADGRGPKRYVRVPKPGAGKKVENLIRSLFIM